MSAFIRDVITSKRDTAAWGLDGGSFGAGRFGVGAVVVVIRRVGVSGFVEAEEAPDGPGPPKVGVPSGFGGRETDGGGLIFGLGQGLGRGSLVGAGDGCGL